MNLIPVRAGMELVVQLNLIENRGLPVLEKKAANIMKELGLEVKVTRNFRITTDSNHKEQASPNILHRRFNVENIITF